MTFVSTALAVAGQLAILTYNIGVLIYVLPIPSKRVKRLAPQLIEDGLSAALLVTLFATLLYISDYIAAMSTFTLDSIASWIRSVLSNILGQYIIFKIGTAILNVIGYFAGIGGTLGTIAYATFVLPLSLILFGIISAGSTILALIYLIASAKAELAALGIALYSLPFRIGRNAGASLLAFVIIGNIMLHFYPHWIMFTLGSVTKSIINIEIGNTSDRGVYGVYGVYYTWGFVHDKWMEPMRYGLVFFEKGNTTLGYLTYADGSFFATSVPLMEGEYNVVLEYMGLHIYPVNTIIDVPDDLQVTYEYTDIPYRLDITLTPYVKLLRPQGLVMAPCVFTNPSITRIFSSSDYVAYSFTAVCANTTRTVAMVVSMPADCAVTSIDVSNNDGSVVIVQGYKPWRGIPLNMYVIKFNVTDTDFTLSMRYACSRSKPVSPQQPNEGVTVSSKVLGWFFPVDLITTGIAFTMLTYAYLTIMSMITAGFASFLGARSPRVIFRG